MAPGGPAVCPRGPGALPPLSLLSPSPGAAALRILAPGREGQDFIPQGRERPSRMPQMAFPSTLCLWDLQENEVRPESLGRQGRPDPKEAQARRSCGPSRTPGPVLGDGDRPRGRREAERGGRETGWEGGGRQSRARYRLRPERLEAPEPVQGPGSSAACCDPGKNPKPQVPSCPPVPPRKSHVSRRACVWLSLTPTPHPPKS